MAAERDAWWRRFATVRARTTLAATVIVGVALVVASVLLVVLLRRSLVDNIDEVAEVRAEDIAALARQEALPEELAVVGDDGGVTHVVDEEGRVLSATAGVTEPIASFRPDGEEADARTVGDFRVVALTASRPRDEVTVYVATSLEPVTETIAYVQGALALGVPILLVLIGLTAWAVVGRALRPVDAIRAEVADISGRSLDRRVPVPSTGDEVSRLATTMNTMLDRLEDSSERQRRFVADASHELQTPLASTRTDLEVALAHPEHSEWRVTARDLLEANERMERLVRDLLFLARADDRGPSLPSTPIDLDSTVLEEVARLRREDGPVVDTGTVSAAAVLGRREELARVVRNLLDNAGRHAISMVQVSLVSDDGEVTLVVADDGPGIPASERERIFERFTRVDGARTRATGGTGLGLAISREIVERHGGTIAVADSPAGARLVVTLPAA